MSEPGAGLPASGSPLTTNRKAVYSVLFGVCAFACIYVFPFGGFALGIPSLTTGIHARREIAASQGTQGGDSLATIGLMIGGGAIITVILSWLLPLLG